MTFFVLIERPGSLEKTLVGPYRSFKRAEGDAKAWSVNGVSASVEPVVKPQDYIGRSK